MAMVAKKKNTDETISLYDIFKDIRVVAASLIMLGGGYTGKWVTSESEEDIQKRIQEEIDKRMPQNVDAYQSCCTTLGVVAGLAGKCQTGQ